MNRRFPSRTRLLCRVHIPRPITACLSIAIALLCSACGATSSGTQSPAAQTSPTAASSTTSTSAPIASTSTTSTSTTSALPGTGRPTVTIGDKNYTEQFLLGELYKEALQAQGFTVELNQNIGPTDVIMKAMSTGSLAMYPEYLNVFNAEVAGYSHEFHSREAAYRAAVRWANAHKLVLLTSTPFSDTGAVAVTVGFAQANHLRSLSDLANVAGSVTFGGPVETDKSTPKLVSLEQTYGFTPQAFKPLAVGAQYGALDNGSVQAAEVQTTDGQLASGDYRLLDDPADLFGWGNAMPVVSVRALQAEGPAFVATINRVSSRLTLPVMQELNQAVDVAGQDPATVARRFLETHGLIPPTVS
jgi:osmoprotectant transport system substrate-binding protein